MLPTQMMKYLDYIFKIFFFSVFPLELTSPPAVSVTSALAHESLWFVTEGKTAGPEPLGWSFVMFILDTLLSWVIGFC